MQMAQADYMFTEQMMRKYMQLVPQFQAVCLTCRVYG
jgi:hypothetical protein